MDNDSKRLPRADWDLLYQQFTQTPDPDEGFTDTGEHWKLIAILNRLGYNPYSRKEAVRLAQQLIDLGYEQGDR